MTTLTTIITLTNAKIFAKKRLDAAYRGLGLINKVIHIQAARGKNTDNYNTRKKALFGTMNSLRAAFKRADKALSAVSNKRKKAIAINTGSVPKTVLPGLNEAVIAMSKLNNNLPVQHVPRLTVHT